MLREAREDAVIAVKQAWEALRDSVTEDQQYEAGGLAQEAIDKMRDVVLAREYDHSSVVRVADALEIAVESDLPDNVVASLFECAYFALRNDKLI